MGTLASYALYERIRRNGPPDLARPCPVNETVETLRGCDQTVLKAGEAVIVQTPTAGGYGQG